MHTSLLSLAYLTHALNPQRVLGFAYLLPVLVCGAVPAFSMLSSFTGHLLAKLSVSHPHWH